MKMLRIYVLTYHIVVKIYVIAVDVVLDRVSNVALYTSHTSYSHFALMVSVDVCNTRERLKPTALTHTISTLIPTH